MKQILKKVKVSEIPQLIAQLGLSGEQEVNITIEPASENLLEMMDKIGKQAQDKGLTEVQLTKLLAGES